MIQGIFISGLLAAAMAHHSQGLSGNAEIDFGRVIPGHYYYYRSYFVNRTVVPLRLSHSSMRCQTCPQLIRTHSWLAPGDSVPLFFQKQFGANIKDSISFPVYIYTDDGQQRGMWIYNLKLRATGQGPLAPIDKPIEIGLNSEGFFEGQLVLVSSTQDTIWVSPQGIPPGFSFSPQMPTRIMPKKSLRIKFTVPPEIVNDHRSLTLEIVSVTADRKYRMSLPLKYR